MRKLTTVLPMTAIKIEFLTPYGIYLRVSTSVHSASQRELEQSRMPDQLLSQEVADDSPRPVVVNSEQEFEVEAILDVRKHRPGRLSRIEALVKWNGYPDPTWEPLSEMQDVSALDEYERTHGPIQEDRSISRGTACDSNRKRRERPVRKSRQGN